LAFHEHGAPTLVTGQRTRLPRLLRRRRPALPHEIAIVGLQGRLPWTRIEDRPVITYDPRNVGRSKRHDESVTPTPEDHAADLHAIIAVIGGPVDLFGSSGGAINGLALAIAHPEERSLPGCARFSAPSLEGDLRPGRPPLSTDRHKAELARPGGPASSRSAFVALFGLSIMETL
jgi:pimeloyl-ACP methyl ester carboxylesterase